MPDLSALLTCAGTSSLQLRTTRLKKVCLFPHCLVAVYPQISHRPVRGQNLIDRFDTIQRRSHPDSFPRPSRADPTQLMKTINDSDQLPFQHYASPYANIADLEQYVAYGIRAATLRRRMKSIRKRKHLLLTTHDTSQLHRIRAQWLVSKRKQMMAMTSRANIPQRGDAVLPPMPQAPQTTEAVQALVVETEPLSSQTTLKPEEDQNPVNLESTTKQEAEGRHTTPDRGLGGTAATHVGRSVTPPHQYGSVTQSNLSPKA